MSKAFQMIITAVQVCIGTALTAASFGLIIIPCGFAAAGVTGLSDVLVRLIHIPLSAMVFLINLALLLLGLLVGKSFVTKTISVSILFPLMLEIFSRYPLTGLEKDPLLCTITAGAMLGAGAGIILRAGASSGGFSVLAVLLNRKWKIPVASVMNISDALIILLQAMDRPLIQTLYGILVITISAAIVGRVVTFGTGESQVMIFSEHHDEIREALLNNLDVGLTSLNAETGFEKKQMKVIVSVVPYQKVIAIKKTVMSVDPTAFVVVDEIHSVLGKGYTLDRYLNPPVPV